LANDIVFRARGSVHPDIQVVERGHIRYLRFGSFGGWQGAMDLQHPDRPVFPYQRAFASLVAALPQGVLKRFLSLGVGTGTGLRVVHRLHPGCALYGVDLDERVIDAATTYFAAPSDATYCVGDGVAYLAASDQPFDLIFVDAYLSDRVYDPCLYPDFVELLQYRLSTCGVAACNVIAAAPIRGAVKEFLDAALRCFPEVQLLPVGMPLTEQNMLAVLTRCPHMLSAWKRTIRHSRWLAWMERTIWPLRLRRLRFPRVV
jgi:spermidine synthase